MSDDVYLRVISGEDKGETFELDPDERITLGRSRSCAIRLADATISARHARLERRGETWFITDMDSTHGTRVNRQRIITAKPLFDRDIVWMGKTLLQFREYEEFEPADLQEVDRGVELPGEDPPAREE